MEPHFLVIFALPISTPNISYVLASDFHYIGENRAVPAVVNSIEELVILQTEKFKNNNFDNAIMRNRRKIKGEQNLRCNLKIWKKNDAFYIVNDISENVTLVQLMDSLGNLNRAISIVGHWIFDSNYNKALFF